LATLAGNEFIDLRAHAAMAAEACPGRACLMSWKTTGVALLLSAPFVVCAQTPTLFGLPTRYTSPGGYQFGVMGLYQYDANEFSGGALDPATDMPLFEDANTWNRREFDAYFKAPNGLEVDVGYDWNRSWTDNYIKYASKQFGDFRLGQFLPQVGWESVEGASTWTFMTPALPGQALFQDRRMGLDWSFDRIPHWLLQAAYYARGNLDGKFPGHTYSGRLVYAPIESKEAVLHFGLAASREFPDDHVAQFSTTPEASLTKTNLVDTSALPLTNSIDRTGLEWGFMRGPLYAQGEYLTAAAHRQNDLPEFRARGYYLFGAWMLTGDTPRTYKDGEFGMPEPEHKYGALEFAVRYSELDLDDGPIQGGREHDWTIGLNWYLHNLKLQADYVWAHANHSPANQYVAPVDPRVFELRAQIYFGS